MTFGEALLEGSKAAMCGYLANGGNLAATNFIAAGVVTPGGQLPAAAGALGLLALNYGCTYDPNKSTSNPLLEGQICTAPGGITQFGARNTGGSENVWNPYDHWDFSVVGVREVPGYVIMTYRARESSTGPLVQRDVYEKTGWVFQFRPKAGCTQTGVPGGVQPPAPHQYTDPVTNCVYNFELQAFDMDEGGNVVPVFKVSNGAPSALASGGIIGGCNFDPVVYRGPGGGGGGGGGPWIPWTPGPDGPDGLPWWFPLLTSAAGGAAAAAIRELLNRLFPQKLPGVTYRLVSVCETDAQGDPVSQAVEHVIPELPTFEALDARLGAIVDIAQGLKDFKQPVCPPQRYVRSGEPVTVTFRSLAPPPGGETLLVKKMNYLDQTNKTQEEHITHWKDFEWQAGPVIVQHKGGGWGAPQVWAASAAEGKRVIRHAAAIAGVNTEAPRSEWLISSTANASYGKSGTMRVSDKGGVIWVTKRSGPFGRGQVANA